MKSTISPRLIALAIALTLAPGAARAAGNNEVTKTKQYDRDYPINEHSECTGDDISGTGRATFVEEYSTTMHKTTFHENCSNCVGTPSVAQYQVNGTTQTQTKTTARNYTDRFDMRLHLLRKDNTGSFPPGTVTAKNDDEFLREYIKTTVKDGEPATTVEKHQLDCK